MNSPTNLKAEFEAQRTERLLSGPAKRLMEKLKPMSSYVEKYQKRWFWELLQNACDYNQNVKVQVELDDNFLYFRHNGEPFSVRDAMNLIFPDSDKDMDHNPDVIGQFGTGFISTHILSSAIRVSGLLKDQNEEIYPVRFHLDRSMREDKQELSKALEIAERELQNISQDQETSNREFPTEFAYEISRNYEFVNFTETYEVGLKFVKEVLPFVFAFVPKLQQVEFITVDEIVTYTRLTGDKFGCQRCSNLPNSDGQNLEVILAQEGSTQVAIAIHDNQLIKCDNIPVLFCAFPMIGSEDFPFPCIINSPEFVPSTERDGIELSLNDKINRSIMLQATIAFAGLLKQIDNGGFHNRFHVAGLQPSNIPEANHTWYKANISDKIRVHLLNSPLVLTKSGYSPLKDIQIPCLSDIAASKEFNRLLSNTILQIPTDDELEMWINVLDFTLFPSLKEDLSAFCARLGRLPSKNNNYDTFLLQDVPYMEWFNQLVELIIKSGEPHLLQKHSIIPMKNGQLLSLKQPIFWDDEIPSSLKNIYDLLNNKPYDSMLINSGLEHLGDQLIEVNYIKTVKDISDEIDKCFNNVNSSKITPPFIDALQLLFEWTEDMPAEEQIVHFPIFTNNKARLMLETLGSDKERNMAFDIIKSDKKEVLAKIAKSEISAVQLNLIIEHAEEFKQFINWKESLVEDEDHADEEIGDIGERHIHQVLINHFKDKPEIEIEWVAKTRNENNYDFEVRRNGINWLFIDAKTTSRGISNSNTVPFFMRTGQWEFLPTLSENQDYYIARVFISGSEISHRFLRIEHKMFS